MKLPPLIGHRGAAAKAPENTLASLRAAKAAGVDWVEFDAQLSGDGVPLLLHDDWLHRTTGDRRKIAQVPAAEATQLDAGGWFGPDFAGETVPRLDSAVALLAELGLGANVEIKPSPGLDRETARASLAVLREAWPESLPLPLISSFEIACLEEAQRLWPEAPRGFLVKALPADWEATVARLGCISVHLWHPGVKAQQVAKIKAAGYQTAAYTVNSVERATLLLQMGLDCLISDDPAALLAVVGKAQAA
ncbi:MAG: glycerophosphodiester phosphodiesterase family protein [Rhodospirillales bacterium]